VVCERFNKWLKDFVISVGGANGTMANAGKVPGLRLDFVREKSQIIMQCGLLHTRWSRGAAKFKGNLQQHQQPHVKYDVMHWL
jgi:hypothetical protein